MTRPLADWLHAENLLLIWAGALLLAFLLSRALIGRFPMRKGTSRRRRTRLIVEMQQGYQFVRRSPLMPDIPGMVELMGGREKALADLKSFFSNVPENMLWNNYYNHANEPVHHVPFLFNRLGAPWLTQYWSRRICRQAYRNAVEGLVGNEDVGQMSAWYVLAASGLHPVCPGETRYEITSPVFDRVEIKPDPAYGTGKPFIIVARNNSEKNVYIQSATLNGQIWNKCWITHEQIRSGGTLELEMGDQPNSAWGVTPASKSWPMPWK